jgi:formate hydrogenlyase subunit 6/NADH:ubiquinone oxidoreductase subunit I
MRIFQLAGTVLKSLALPPATRMYPKVARIYQTRTRGHIAIDIDACIFCGMCSRRCPTQALEVDKPGRTWSIERLGCIQCNSCVELCPKKCLTMETSYTPPSAGSVHESFTASAPVPAAPATPAASGRPTPDARVSGNP